MRCPCAYLAQVHTVACVHSHEVEYAAVHLQLPDTSLNHLGPVCVCVCVCVRVRVRVYVRVCKGSRETCVCERACGVSTAAEQEERRAPTHTHTHTHTCTHMHIQPSSAHTHLSLAIFVNSEGWKVRRWPICLAARPASASAYGWKCAQVYINDACTHTHTHTHTHIPQAIVL